jgi:magnesium chelatase subunit D
VTDAGPRFPFSSVVGQEDAKLALILAAIDPLIGGVLLRGEKGSAKTTLARGMAGLLASDAPFVELPLGATEDRLIGTLDIGRALVDGDMTFTPGLLAQADRGVLYVDEVNLLADHLVDTLLDVAVSGRNRVEREGISHDHSSRFVLVGSMNPEEGELRPQLLDRFGLSVSVAASLDVDERVEAVRRRLAFDRFSTSGDDIDAADTELTTRLAAARPAEVGSDVMELAVRLALAVGAEGLRADIVLCRAAAAFAGWGGRDVTTDEDVRRVAPLVLGHRSRRNPFDPPTMPPEDIDRAFDEALDDRDEQPDDAPHDEGQDPSEEQAGDSGAIGHSAMALGADRQPPSTSSVRSRPVESARGRAVRTVDAEPGTQRSIAVVSSARRLVERRLSDPDATASRDDLRHTVREQPPGNLIVLAVDVSGSMGAIERAEAATGTALGLLTDAYQRRDHVAVVTFAGDDATVELAPTASVEVARNRLTGLRTGGATPLAAGIQTSLELIIRQRDATRRPLLVLMSDGRATGAVNAVEDALAAAAEVARHQISALVVDCETGIPRIGLAGQIAEAMHARCVAAHDLEPRALAALIRNRSLEGSS